MTEFSNTKIRKILVAMLTPVIKLYVKHGVKVRDIEEDIRKIAVAIAEEEISKSGASVSISKMSAITGIYRADILRIQLDKEKKNPSEQIAKSSIDKVIGQWLYDESFSIKHGEPRALTYEGLSSEFCVLVSKVCKDISPYTVLFELERLGYVERTNSGLRLRVKTHVNVNKESGLNLLANDINGLINSVSDNIDGKQDLPNLHLRTEYTEIPEEHIPKLKKWLLKAGSVFHQKLSDYLAKFDTDLNSDMKAKGRKTFVSVTSFSNTGILTRDLNKILKEKSK